MSRNEWRITQNAIEAEMLRLAALLSTQSRSTATHAGLGRYEAKSSNAALRGALTAVATGL
jgi:hypothetical protein